MGPTKKSIEANNKAKRAAKADKMMAETANYVKSKKAPVKKPVTTTKLGATPKKEPRGNIMQVIKNRKDLALKY